ncbi:MAG: hypothetical protein GY772_16105 [bacterium]|nr:hypothetical protein [bacterium]
MNIHKGIKDEIFNGFECNECHQRFVTVHGRKTHKGVKHPILKPIECIECHHRFATVHGLKSHQGVKHPKIINKPHACNQCRKHFITIHGLKTHQGVKHPKCNQCKKQFLSRFALKTHIGVVHKSKVKQEICAAENEQNIQHSLGEINLIPISGVKRTIKQREESEVKIEFDNNPLKKLKKM